MNNKILNISNLTKNFSSKENIINIINNLSLDIYNGEFISIVGTSGCGKTTLLNIIGGIDKEYEGNINYYINKDEIGYMLQEPALFPWLTIKDNASIALKIKNTNDDKTIDKLLNEYGLNLFENKYPDSLSGGMKQRVALIRTISLKPKLLLLDEPFAALDYQSRLKIGNDLYKLTKKNNITTIMITHDIAEAISLSDRIVVLSKRPCNIKKIYTVDIDKNLNPIEKRNDNNFKTYFESICKDLEIYEK